MKKNKKINHFLVPVVVAYALIFIVSCQKENPKELTNYQDLANLSKKNMLNLFSPWLLRSSGINTPQRGIIEMSEPDQTTCYGLVIDNFYNQSNDITFTHDGGATWHLQTITELENNYDFGVAATTSKEVHVLGWNFVNGGGNIFRSRDGGVTWQREAANTYTDPASFPDAIKFLNQKNGVIFGDPLNGSFEIYTTNDGGNKWKAVPSANIPPPEPNEYGSAYIADTYKNTIWMFTQQVDDNFNVVGGRLLQSDNNGLSWYVKNSSMPVNGGDGALKFRDRYVGLFKNNATLYRTTDGGATWKQVNYSGNWFSFDLDNIPGLPGWWISTGGDADGSISTNSAYGFGSSISYDDGNHWVTLDTLNHSCVDMTSPFHGYSGGFTTADGNGGVYVYSLLSSRLSSIVSTGNNSTNNANGIKLNLAAKASPLTVKFAALKHFRN